MLGNGVACDVSCWMEACVAARHIDNAGEMNGFLKAKRMLLDPPLHFDDGHIVLVPAAPPTLDSRAVAGYTVAHASHRRELHAPAGTVRYMNAPRERAGAKRFTLVTGVIGSDTHIVGNRILSMALEKAGYRWCRSAR